MSDPEWDTHLRPLRTVLTNGLRVSGALLDLLVQTRVLDNEERSIVDRVYPNTEEEKVRQMLELLQRKPAGTFDKFCSVLEDSSIGREKLAKRLRSGEGEDEVDAKMEETSNGDNIASDKNHDVRGQRPVVLNLVVLLSVSAVVVVLAIVLSKIIYPTDHEPTPIREKAAVPLATDSDNDQVTFVELRKIAEEVGSHWHPIGIYMGFSGETLTQYEKQFNEPSRLLFEILGKWQKQKGEQATKNELLEACRQAGVRGACERVFKKMRR
ncbi:uncharacterized protein LOC134196429 isoform X2 [Corticium candelabrum]|uniref:uncharacterized protein LOC134196429 isoform X2 n=1 Tax=Corticium candelabrum TaxID=121492 RepID=UPI002E25C6E3|nr:uncharacterized protein LOC134196429 isoform X2 [Corticium candelabrum]